MCVLAASRLFMGIKFSLGLWVPLCARAKAWPSKLMAEAKVAPASSRPRPWRVELVCQFQGQSPKSMGKVNVKVVSFFSLSPYICMYIHIYIDIYYIFLILFFFFFSLALLIGCLLCHNIFK